MTILARCILDYVMFYCVTGTRELRRDIYELCALYKFGFNCVMENLLNKTIINLSYYGHNDS